MSFYKMTFQKVSSMLPKKSVNTSQKGELTPEKLRSYTGFEDFSDEQAKEAIQNIKKMAQILFLIYQDNSPSENPIK